MLDIFDISNCRDWYWKSEIETWPHVWAYPTWQVLCNVSWITGAPLK